MTKSLSAKEQQTLGTLHERLTGGSYSEIDVSALLVLLRERSRGGAILELANSIAHSERNSGEFFQRIKANQHLLNNLGKASCESFYKSLTKTLSEFGLSALPRETTDAMFLCGLSLLQGSSVKGGKTFGELSLSLTQSEFQLMATVPIDHKGKQVRASFILATVTNRWIPVCNPRAHVQATGPVLVSVAGFSPKIHGFKRYEVQIERAPPIAEREIDALARLQALRLRRTESGVTFEPDKGEEMPLVFSDGRLTVEGLPQFFRKGSPYEEVLRMIRTALDACVHDDSNAHWFLPGLQIPDDGFHCHWVGAGSGKCIRRL
jgi:hypothetical protein